MTSHHIQRSRAREAPWLSECSIFVCLKGALLIVVYAIASMAFMMDPLHALPSIDPRVVKKLEEGGAARILVVFAEQEESNNSPLDLNSPSQFLSRLLGKDSSSVRQIGGLPIAVTEINHAGLELLESNRLVAAVYADEPERHLLHMSLPLMGIDSTYEKSPRGDGYSIAILDSGVNYEHPFLKGKLKAEACFSTSESDLYAVRTLCPNEEIVDMTPGSGLHCKVNPEECSHGTHVAGIALGGFDNKENPQGSGVAHEAGLISIQVFTEFSDPWVCGKDTTPCIMSFPSNQIAALGYIRTLVQEGDLKVAAVNMSLGGKRRERACNNDPRGAIVQELRNLGVATVIASGNDAFHDAVSEPACIPEAITVAASKSNDAGLNTGFSNASDLVDFVAPGTGITSSLTQGFGMSSGTSMAAPHVAGAFALLRSHVPSATVIQIETALQATSKRVVDPRTDLEFHFPDVGKAANKLEMLAGNSERIEKKDAEVKNALKDIIGSPRIMVVIEEEGIMHGDAQIQTAKEQIRNKFGPVGFHQVTNNLFILERRQGFDLVELGYVAAQFGENTKLYSDTPNRTQ